MAHRVRSIAPSFREILWFLLWAVVVGFLYLAAKTLIPARKGAPIALSSVPLTHASPLTPSRTEAAGLRQKAPSPAYSKSVSNGRGRKTGWAPDAKEESGDARQIFAEEVQWLQDRLSKVVPKLNPPQNAHELASRIAKRIGTIPYEAQSHGWSLPEQTKERNVGDCQDKSLLLAELLIEAGIEEVAICRGVDESYKPGEPGHAWVLAMLGTELWKIESTNGAMYRANSGSHLDRYETIATVWRLPAKGARR